jgi:hypothetical protein
MRSRVTSAAGQGGARPGSGRGRGAVAILRGRHPVYLLNRLGAVTHRYGATSAKAKQRVRRCMRSLEPLGLQPTFATPGRVVESDPGFFSWLSEAGAELAIHGYDHADFRRLSPEQASWQFERAIAVYDRHGIPWEGFRCPYLSYGAEERRLLPEGAFAYSSNRAVAWPVGRGGREEGPVFAQLARNYRAAPSEDAVCTPSLDDGLVEIPASVPDDLQLCDGLGLGIDGLLEAWIETLEQTHRREEVFAPLFHPEAYDLIKTPFEGLVRAAAAQRPAVWLTQLRHVARWWRERAGFRVTSRRTADGLSIELECSERATVLARGWRWRACAREWDGRWSVLDERRFLIDDGTRPFVGLSGVDSGTVAFLREQGYLVDDGRHAELCGTHLTRRAVETLGSRRALVEHLEAGEAPLLRFSRWPRGAKSALCLAGDLDALSLWHYLERLRPSVRARTG